MVKLKLTLLALAAWLSVSVGHAEDSVYVYHYSQPLDVYGMQYLDSIWADMERQRLCFSFPKDVFEKLSGETEPGLPNPEWEPEVSDPVKDYIMHIIYNMVYVQGGYTLMGAQRTDESQPNYFENADPREAPVHRVYLSSFYMNRFELNSSEYQMVMSGRPTNIMPQDGLSWQMAQAFVDRLNHLCRIPGYEFSLPTEAQWEYAARGGGHGRGCEYSGSNVAAQVGWIVTNSGMELHEVGKLLPNELGIYDMTGNVYEWCKDWYGDYDPNDNIDPQGPAEGTLKVCRGGCFVTDKALARNAYRMNFPPDATSFLGTLLPAGIRLVLNRKAANHYLTVTPATITAIAEGGTYTVSVQSDESFYVASSPEWCTVQTNAGELSITVAPNYSGAERTAQIEVATANVTAFVSVTQPTIPVITISPDLPRPEDFLNRIAWNTPFPEHRETIEQLVRSLVCVAGGEYFMGAQKDNANGTNYDPNATVQESFLTGSEAPVHPVRLSSFYLSKFQMTRQQYQRLMDNDPAYFKGSWNYPVENLSWNDAQALVNKINQLCGLTFSLPTEAQWEYAARGGNKRQAYNIYSGSNNSAEVGWTSENAAGNDPATHTHDVGTLAPNELGIYDMTGNVFEWCQDWYHAYTTETEWNPMGAPQGTTKVARGGCQALPAIYARNSTRLNYDPDSHQIMMYNTLPAGVRMALAYEEVVYLDPNETYVLDISGLGADVSIDTTQTSDWCHCEIADGRVTVTSSSDYAYPYTYFYINSYVKRVRVNVGRSVGFYIEPMY